MITSLLTKSRPHVLKGMHRWLASTDSAVQQIGWEICVRRIFPKKSPALFCLVNAFSVVEAHRNGQHMVALWEADWLIPDGVVVAKMLRSQRTAGADLMLSAARNPMLAKCRHTLLGGFGVAYRAAIRQFQEVDCTFVQPPFVPSLPTDSSLIAMANAIPCDVLWLSLGCPIQESWALEHRSSLSAKVVIPVGAAFDFLAGRVRRAPRWIQNIGMEAVYRIWADPTRWRRQMGAAVGFVRLVARGR